MEEELQNIITLQDEEGKDVRFDLVMTFDYEGKKYAAMFPLDEVPNVGEDEVVILEIRHDGAEEIYAPIENPVLLDEVFDTFCELFDAMCDEGEEGEEAPAPKMP